MDYNINILYTVSFVSIASILSDTCDSDTFNATGIIGQYYYYYIIA